MLGRGNQEFSSFLKRREGKGEYEVSLDYLIVVFLQFLVEHYT